jgi:hypothetical protein
MKNLKDILVERLVISKKPKELTNLYLIELIKDYRNYAPGRTPGKYLFLQSYMNDGKEFIVQSGQHKGYYIWYTPYETSRLQVQKEFIWFTIKKDKFSYMEDTIVAKNTEELIELLGEEAAYNFFNFLLVKTHRIDNEND